MPLHRLRDALDVGFAGNVAQDFDGLHAELADGVQGGLDGHARDGLEVRPAGEGEQRSLRERALGP